METVAGRQAGCSPPNAGMAELVGKTKLKNKMLEYFGDYELASTSLSCFSPKDGVHSSVSSIW